MTFSQEDDDEDLDECGVEEEVFDIDTEVEEEGENVEKEEIKGTCRLEDVKSELMSEEKFVVSRTSLETLLGMYPKKTCNRCGKQITWKLKTIGCTVDCKWVCKYIYWFILNNQIEQLMFSIFNLKLHVVRFRICTI